MMMVATSAWRRWSAATVKSCHDQCPRAGLGAVSGDSGWFFQEYRDVRRRGAQNIGLNEARWSQRPYRPPETKPVGIRHPRVLRRKHPGSNRQRAWMEEQPDGCTRTTCYDSLTSSPAVSSCNLHLWVGLQEDDVGLMRERDQSSLLLIRSSHQVALRAA